MNIESDVAVVGGGAAGTATALALLRHTRHRVVLLERTSYRVRRVGETVSSGLAHLLSYLDASALLSRHGVRSTGRTAFWGSPVGACRDSIFDPAGANWHLDRAAFDAGMCESVANAGGTVLLDTPAVTASREDGTWTIATKGRHACRVHAQQLVLAAGATSGLGRSLGLRRRVLDRLTALVSWSPYGRSADLLIEATPDGWWYSASFGNGSVVAFLTDADLIPTSGSPEEEMKRALKDAPATTSKLAERSDWTPPRYFAARSSIASQSSGDGWVAAGDFVATFDPLSSLGIGSAMAAGIQASMVANERLCGRGDHGARFSSDINTNFLTYAEGLRSFYRRERRWADRAFWARRIAFDPNAAIAARVMRPISGAAGS